MIERLIPCPGGHCCRTVPALPAVVTLALGILSTTATHLYTTITTTSVVIWCSAVLLLAVGALRAERRVSATVQLLVWLALGAGLGFWHTRVDSSSYLRLLPAGDQAHVQLQAVVVADRLLRTDELRALEDKRQIEVEITALRADNASEWRPCSGRVALNERPEGVHYGQSIVTVGTLREPLPADLPGLFDYQQYLRTQGIRHVFYLSEFATLVESPVGWRRIPVLLLSTRERLLGRAVRGVSTENQAAVAAMTLGFRQGMDPKTKESYIDSGMIHLFAISGLHVGILFGLLLLVLAAVRCPFRWRYWLAPVLLFAYVCACGAPASAVRAWAMLTIWSLGRARDRPVTAVNSLFAAALMILLWSPFQLFQSGFQFSFCVVLCLIRGWNAGEVFVRSCGVRNALIPPRHRRRTWWSATGRKVVIQGTIGVTAAWLGSIGLTAYYNYLLIPGSLLTNLAAGTLAWVLMVAVLLNVALCDLAWAEAALSWSIDGVLEILGGCAELSRYLGGSWGVAQPQPAQVVAFYLCLAVALFATCSLGRRALLFSLVGCVIVTFTIRPPGQLTVFVPRYSSIPVVVLERNHGSNPIVINAGGADGAYALVSWLRHRGWRELDALWIVDNRKAFTGAAEQLLSGVDCAAMHVLARDSRELKELHTAAWTHNTRWEPATRRDKIAGPTYAFRRQQLGRCVFADLVLQVEPGITVAVYYQTTHYRLGAVRVQVITEDGIREFSRSLDDTVSQNRWFRFNYRD